MISEEVTHKGLDRLPSTVVDAGKAGMVTRLSLVKGRLIRDDMTRDGLIMVFFGMLTGLFNYLYQLSMGIMLTPAEFGTLFSLFSLFMIVWWFSQALQTPIAKFVSTYNAQGDLQKAADLWRYSLKRTLIVGGVVFIAAAALAPVISSTLKINNDAYPVLLFSAAVLALSVPVNNGTLRGLQRFVPLGLSNSLLAFIKFSLAALLVGLGCGIYGGLVPIVLAYCVSFAVSLYFLRRLPSANGKGFEINGVRSYAGYSMLALAAFAILTNADAVMAKYYLSADSAGSYAAIAVLGKIALFAPAGVSIAMLPKASALHETGRPHGAILKKSLALVLLIGGAVVVFYLAFPHFISDVVLRGKYDIAAADLFKYAVAMLLYASAFLLMNYSLALNRARKLAYALLLIAVLQVSLLVCFHLDISQMVNMVLISSTACLALMIPLYVRLRNGTHTKTI